MTQDLIREVAEAVVRDQLILNWHFYVLIGSASIVAGIVAQFVASYLKKRGDTFATKTDMKEIYARCPKQHAQRRKSVPRWLRQTGLLANGGKSDV